MKISYKFFTMHKDTRVFRLTYQLSYSVISNAECITYSVKIFKMSGLRKSVEYMHCCVHKHFLCIRK